MADRNEMCVSLIDGFRLRADDDNWIIEEEVGKEGKKKWKVYGYYQKIGIALHDVFTVLLRRSPSHTVDDLIKATERIQQAVIRAVMPLDSWGVKSPSLGKVKE